MYLQSINGIAYDLFDKLAPDLIVELRTIPLDDMVLYHSTMGRHIRNEYGLWNTDHPLTKSWHTNLNRDVRNGVDYSTDHPDHISSRVMELIWKMSQ